jgi:hypothetical protein
MKLTKCRTGSNTELFDSLVQTTKGNDIKLFSTPSYHLTALGKKLAIIKPVTSHFICVILRLWHRVFW